MIIKDHKSVVHILKRIQVVLRVVTALRIVGACMNHGEGWVVVIAVNALNKLVIADYITNGIKG